MPRVWIILFTAATLLISCASPDFEDPVSPAARTSSYPKLISLDGKRASIDADQDAVEEATDDLSDRAKELRKRAKKLRKDVLDKSTKNNLSAAQQRHPT